MKYFQRAKTFPSPFVLNKNNQVCIEFDADHDLFARHEEVACSWRMRYRSVIVWGKAEFISDYNKKVDGLKIFMKNYSDLNFEFSTPSVNNIHIIKIPIDKMTGRKFEY